MNCVYGTAASLPSGKEAEMVSFVRISLKYSAMIRRAKTLRHAASDCEENQQTVKQMIETISAGLEGEAASELLDKLTKWQSENAALKSDMLRAASSLESIAESIKAADEAAAARSASGDESGGGFR